MQRSVTVGILKARVLHKPFLAALVMFNFLGYHKIQFMNIFFAYKYEKTQQYPLVLRQPIILLSYSLNQQLLIYSDLVSTLNLKLRLSKTLKTEQLDL